MRQVTRAIVLWCPDWPVIAARQRLELPAEVPLALIEKGMVFACSSHARADGVTRGLRVREAQSRCPQLEIVLYDPVLDARAFEPVLTAIEEITPGVQAVRPGTCVLRARGPARYYGGEEAAAAELLRCLEGLENVTGLALDDVRIGIADGPFAAEQAARSTGLAPSAGVAQTAPRVRIVPPGGSPAFLAPLPVAQLGLAELTPLLRRLGLRSLGDLARLDRLDVRERFGERGEHAHDLASGMDGAAVVPRTPPKVLDRAIEFEPPLDRVDQVTFAFRGTAEQFVAGLTKAGLVCTSLRIEVTDERGRVSERSWQHPRLFSASDVVDRVRWQLQGAGSIDSGLASPIAKVAVAPEAVDDIGHHEDGLWGGGADERIHHGLTRVQGMLGHDAVVTATIGGGRALSDRQVLVPWGDRPVGVARSDRPWPGSLPAPAPSTVFEVPRPVAVLNASGEPVEVTDRGDVTAPIVSFSPTGSARDARPVDSWAGPWPVRERWWDTTLARAMHRFQLVDADGTAWLLALTGTAWVAEARYD
ncbi:DNA polymerase Y family protein [Leifsonia shinshuensis]|uniref:DNA polymerase Y family protein n=1 Tax=Leifsonia shinshuensis TaxID=150026 RepID=A0A7G6Y785_9MICO|nr:DNA polymerase Y family protein [Leifsonia shinshuensis]QNE34350.1 DNA polymerase Y family protein [Leifsonia shinshuensis]